MGLYEIARLPTILIRLHLMIESNRSVTTVDLNSIQKTEWQEPQMTKLNIKETKSLSWNVNTETPLFQGNFLGTPS